MLRVRRVVDPMVRGLLGEDVRPEGSGQPDGDAQTERGDLLRRGFDPPFDAALRGGDPPLAHAERPAHAVQTLQPRRGGGVRGPVPGRPGAPLHRRADLPANGEPIGASELRPVQRGVLQLRGPADARQVPGGPKVGYTPLYVAPGVAGISILSA